LANGSLDELLSMTSTSLLDAKYVASLSESLEPLDPLDLR
jgi:hypothetical protein